MRKKIDYKHLIEDVCGFRCEDGNYSKPLPSLTAQEALNELRDYFLGEDWYEPTGQVHPEIVNFAIVEAIEKMYRGAKIKKKRNCDVKEDGRMKECACFTCKCSYDSGEYDICQYSDDLCAVMCIKDCTALNNTGKTDLCDYCQNSDHCGLKDGDGE